LWIIRRGFAQTLRCGVADAISDRCNVLIRRATHLHDLTGLYFDPFDKRRAWLNIQRPDSENDRTIEITIP
jgi:hypothetical protein